MSNQLALPTFSKGDLVKYQKYEKSSDLTCKVISYTESVDGEGIYKIVDTHGRIYCVTPSQVCGI